MHKDIAAGHRNDRAVVGNAIFLVRLRGRHFVIAAEFKFAIDDVVDGVCAPCLRVRGAAARSASAAPFVGEQNFSSVIVECRGMPIGETGICDIVDALGFARI